MRKAFVAGFIFGAVCSGILVFGYAHKKGVEKRAQRDINGSIPILVQIHRSIEAGETNRAMSQIGMVLIGKLERYEELEGEVEFPTAKRAIGEARRIVEKEKARMVNVGPEKEIIKLIGE